MITFGLCAAIFATMVLVTYVPGWLLVGRASSGDPVAQFEYARWTETHCDTISEFIVWPCEPDVYGSYAWTERAADHSYPPAVYALGVRLKHGWFVPPPEGWSGPGGNVFRQPQRGQELIDRAITLGYKPPVPEEQWWAWWRGIRLEW